jgi:transcription elongation factor GreA
MVVAIRPPSGIARWPMTTPALRALAADLAQLRAQLRILGGPAQTADTHVAWVVARNRYETLSAVLDDAERADGSPAAVIGRRVTLREEDGASVEYELVCPGEGDPAQGWVAADSPLGRALLGALAGETIRIEAPGGSRMATVLSVA